MFDYECTASQKKIIYRSSCRTHFVTTSRDYLWYYARSRTCKSRIKVRQSRQQRQSTCFTQLQSTLPKYLQLSVELIGSKKGAFAHGWLLCLSRTMALLYIGIHIVIPWLYTTTGVYFSYPTNVSVVITFQMTMHSIWRIINRQTQWIKRLYNYYHDRSPSWGMHRATTITSHKWKAHFCHSQHQGRCPPTLTLVLMALGANSMHKLMSILDVQVFNPDAQS